MDKVLRYLFSRSLLANLTSVFVLLFGLFTLLNLPKEDFPAIDFDVVTVITPFPGATPSQVERLVTNPLEEEIRTVFGIKDMFSTSAEGLSSIIVVIDPDYKDKDESITEIQRAVDRVADLPEDVDQPLVNELKTEREPSIVVTIKEAGDEISANLEPSLELRSCANKLQRVIEQHPLVAEVDLQGEEDLEYEITVSSEKLRDLGISVDELVQALSSQNLSVAGGESSATNGSVRYRVDNELTTQEKIEDVVLRATVEGQVFRLGDIAEIRLKQKEGIFFQRAEGKPAFLLNVIRKQEADVLELADDVTSLAEDFRDRINDPVEKIEIGFSSDLADIVRVRLGSLTSSILIGGALVFLLLFLSLNLSTAIIVAIGIPFSFLGAVILMPPLDLSINLLTMFGFVVVLGMLVDDAIVVSESIFSELENGADHLTAAIEGTKKVFIPVLGAVMTSVLAFLPLVFMAGIFGKFVKFIPIIVILCLLVSLLEAFFVLPNHMRDFARLGKKKDAQNHPFERVRQMYRRIVTYCVKHRYIVALASWLFIAAALGAYILFGRYDNFPDEGIESFYVTLTGEPQLSKEDMAERLLPIEKAVAEIPQEFVDASISFVGQTQVGGAETREQGSNFAQVSVFLTAGADSEIDIDEVMNRLRPVVEQVPDIQEFQMKKLAGGPPEGDPVTVFFRADDLEMLREVVEEAREVLESTEGVHSIADSDSPGKAEAVYEVNFERALQTGVNPQFVARGIQMAVEGAFLGEVKSDIETTRLLLKVDDGEKPEEAFQNLSVVTGLGERIPVANLIDLKRKEPGLYQIRHYNAQRAIVLTAEVFEDQITALEANRALEEHYEKWVEEYPGLNIVPLGANRDTQESFESLQTTALIALMGVAFVMIVTIGSLWQPIVVFSSVPLGLAGVIFIFLIHGQPLSFLALFGIVGLLGVAVNVGIVLIDRINSLAQSMPYREALIEGSVARLRAVLLTSATTVSGLMPTAYGWGGGDEFLKPMALALGWGIAFATILGILTIPVYLAIIDDLRLWVKKLRA